MCRMIKDAGFNFDNTYAQLPEAFYTRVPPVPVAAPEMALFNAPLAEALGLDFSGLSQEDMAALFAGNQLPEGADPLAQAYAGHQFGHFGMLGDGRAVLLGEHLDGEGRRHDIQLKGSGRTPYSRSGDGRAVLGPMLREYIISEAMHELGIPTTRSLAVAKTGERVARDVPLPGAILTRVASSHIRVGTFEYAAARRDTALTEALLDYTAERHYPDWQQVHENKALAVLESVMERQAELIVHWLRVGFIHGVMNTDNMTLSGESIDYGPCAFMDEYDPATVFSSIDHQGRYAYGNQPWIAQWNLARLAECLLPLMGDDIDASVELVTPMIKGFPERYHGKWLPMMRAKLGLFGEHEADEQLIMDLLEWMHANKADFTNTFRALSQEHQPEGELYQAPGFGEWYTRWQGRLAQNTKPLKSSVCLMRNSNPAVIPRNHKVEEALVAAEGGDITHTQALLEALKIPYKDTDRESTYLSPPVAGERVCQTFCGT